VFTATQRDRLRNALEARAASAPTRNRGPLRRAAREGRVFDRLVERKAAELRKANPGAGDGEIFKLLLDWIANGGLEKLLSFIMTIIGLFAKK
jgi:hypothetical protein